MTIRAVICLPDYGFDPTEAAVPYTYLSDRGVECHVATQNGQQPACDSRMIEGWTGTILGAKQSAREAYTKLSSSTAFKSPLSWSSSEFSLPNYDAVILPGGHDKGVRQIIENEDLKVHLREYFLLTEGERATKVCGAICHGVMVLAWTKDAESQHSILYDRKTTTLPLHLERLAVYGTAPLLGDYYRTYSGTWTSREVIKSLKSPEQYLAGPFNFSLSHNQSAAHVVKDGGYISARWPGDAQAFSEALWERLQSVRGTSGPVATE